VDAWAGASKVHLPEISITLPDNPKGNVWGVCPIQNVLSTALYKN